MKNRLYRLPLTLLSAFLILQPAHIHAKERKHKSHSSSESHHKSTHAKFKSFTHNIQLQLADSLGFPVSGTEFDVELEIVQIGSQVTIHLPSIGFQTGPSDDTSEQLAGVSPLFQGGYLFTANGFLPESIRPTHWLPVCTVAPCNVGLSTGFTFAQDPATIEDPLPGYIIQVTNAGELNIQAAGKFGNIIPPGNQIVLPTSISYNLSSTKELCENVKISKSATNTTHFIRPSARDNALRDSHIMDAYGNTIVWAWTDNSMIPDQTNGVLNLMVAVGKVVDGKLKVGKPIALTNFPADADANHSSMAWDTSVAINRADPKNIIVSYETQQRFPTGSFPYTRCRAVSFDGGKTWPDAYDGTTTLPFNGPIADQPVDGAGDNNGVRSDQYGNIWYLTSNFYDSSGDFINYPLLFVSFDKGVTYTQFYNLPITLPDFDPSIDFWDYPQMCFGGDGLGNYGLHLQASRIDFSTSDYHPNIVFIPITGAGLANIGTPQFQPLPQFTNKMVQTNLASSVDGRLWLQGLSVPQAAFPTFPYTFIDPVVVGFKSPGEIDQNYAGPWHQRLVNMNGIDYEVQGITTVVSQPIVGYIPFSTQSIVFDEKRQALYAVVTGETPDFSQDMTLSFSISRNNGLTWSKPIKVASTKRGNRGFQSMALDEKTGNLVFGWYDGRHDKSYESLEYYGAVVPAKALDSLVRQIPLTNPLFTIPAPDSDMVERSLNQMDRQQAMKRKQDFMEKRLKG